MLIVFLSLPLLAQSRDAVIDQTIATLSRVVEFEQVAISPDGTNVALVTHSPGGHERLYAGDGILSAAGFTDNERGLHKGSRARYVPPETDESDPAWSPDSKEVAFISAESGRPEIYVVSANRRNLRKLTDINAAFSKPKWSPDGKKIAVLAIENPSRKGGALVAMTPPSGDVETQVEEQRLAIVDVATKSLTWATPVDMYVFDYDWSPDSKSIVIEAVHGSGDDNYWTAALYRCAASGGDAKLIYKPSLQIATPRWSRDGKSIAFIEGLMSDEGNTGGDVFVIPANGGAAVNVTPGLRASATTLQWLADSRSLLIGEHVNGRSGFARVAADGSGVTQLWSGDERVSNGELIAVTLANDGVTTAVVRESYTKPPDVWRGKIGEWTQLTHLNDDVKPLWGNAKNIEWTSDQFHVQGWLISGTATQSAKLPMIVQVHGGPSSGVVPAWPSLNLAALAASGYAVFLPNPRGSYGQGEAFAQANVKDFGRGDFRDILTGVDAAIASAPIDKDRVGIWGWSYGGYMTMWAVTQTTRFRAAVAGAGIVNFESYYGQNSIDQWMIPFFGASVYDDPMMYRRSSPIEYIKNVKTPTLVLVGDRDGEVPAPQSFEFYHALKTLGVKTKLIVYPDEGHRFVKAEHRRDVAKRLVVWFDENM